MTSGAERGRAAIAVAAVALTVSYARAGVSIPFTEDFTVDASNWVDAVFQPTLTWHAAGGPDGSSYVSTTYNVPDPIPPFGAIAFRGHDEFDASNDAFVGDWKAGQVKEFSFWIRHDATLPIDVFSRFATSNNFPGAAGVWFAPVLPNIWTLITIDVTKNSPQLVLEGSPWESVFENVGNVQIGINPSDPLIGQTITIDIDRISMTPAPGALGLLLVGGAWLRPGRVRRARR